MDYFLSIKEYYRLLNITKICYKSEGNIIIPTFSQNRFLNKININVFFGS